MKKLLFYVILCLSLVAGVAQAQIGPGGAVTINLGTGPVSSSNPFPVDCITGCSGGGGGGGAVTAAAGSYAEGYSVDLGTIADTAWSGTGNGTLIAIEKSIHNLLAASLPLPTGAATSALQTSGNTSLSTIASNTTSILAATNPGQTTAAITAPGVQIQCQLQTTEPTAVSGAVNNCQVDSRDNIRVALYAAGSANGYGGIYANGVANINVIGSAGVFNTVPNEVATGTGVNEQTDQYGSTFNDAEGLKPSDSSFVSFVPASGILWSMCGSATKTIRIRSLIVSGIVTTTIGTLNLSVLKTSTAPSGGTATALTFVANSTVGATSNTATGNAYTAAPTGGTSLGAVGGGLLGFQLAGAQIQGLQLLQQGSPIGTQTIVLSGVAQCIEISTASTTLPLAIMDVSEVHTEE